VLEQESGSYLYRNPFDDNLLASGSDDGKVRDTPRYTDRNL
jgi:hypothetical protein